MTTPSDHSSLINWQDGQPYSKLFGDVYFARESGLAETRHVFLAGNALEARWARLAPRAHFVIGETGFGTGLNFLCAWQLWERVAPHEARLHYLSVERYPLAAANIERALAGWPELAPHRDELLKQWGDFLPGWHRLEFAEGRVHLTLVIDDVRSALARIDAAADAWFLDGFAPAKNPAMWAPEVLADVARLSRTGATCATYTVAGYVRRGLEAAGFAMEKTNGFGAKREMLRGALVAPLTAPWRPPWFARTERRVERRAIVVGGGLAGAATASSLAARGWTVDLIERHPQLAAEASGNPQGVLYARLSSHSNVLGELAAAGLQHTHHLLHRLPLECGTDFDTCGVLQLGYDHAEADRQERIAALGLPRSLVQPVNRTEASTLAGVALASGGLLLPCAGWVNAAILCRTLSAHPAVRVILGRNVRRLRPITEGWEVADDIETIARAPVVIIAGAGGSSEFVQTRQLPLRLIRGQLTYLPETPESRALCTVLCGEGYVAPARAGKHSLGATHKFRDPLTAVVASEHAENLARLAQLSPALHAALGGDGLDPTRLEGWAALRCSTPDYLPLIGPVVDAVAFASVYAPLARDATLQLDARSPYLDGLYVNTAHGSRGLITGPLSGAILAAYLNDEPGPLPRSVMEAVHPSRFLLRALIRRRENRARAPA